MILWKLDSHFLSKSLHWANDSFQKAKVRHLKLFETTKDVTWLQHVPFTDTYLCLFDNICRIIYSQLSDDTLVDNIYNPINIYKCIIVPSYAIGTYFLSLLQPSNFIKQFSNRKTVFEDASQVFLSCTPTSEL